MAKKPPKAPSLLYRVLNTEFKDYYREFVKRGKIRRIVGGREFVRHLDPRRRNAATRFHLTAVRVHKVALKAQANPTQPIEVDLGAFVIEYEESEGILWVASKHKDLLSVFSDTLAIYCINHEVKTLDNMTLIRVYIKDALNADFRQW